MDRDTKIDSILTKLFSLKNDLKRKKILNKADIRFISDNSIAIFKEEPSLLRISGKFTICGDIHGEFYDLLNLLELSGTLGETKYLFLGDFLDRGDFSVNTICLLLALKIKYPETFFLIRGNHESSAINRYYGFHENCCELYSEHIWPILNNVFDWMPIASLVNNKILCVHGGISPELTNLEDINKIERPCDVPLEGLMCDLLWSDPVENCENWTPSHRKCGYLFGEKQTNEVIEKLGITTIVRSHECVPNGLQYPFFPNKSLITVFSCPADQESENKAAYLTVDESCDIQAHYFEQTQIRPQN